MRTIKYFLSFTLIFLTGCAGFKPNIYIPQKMPKPLTMENPVSIALVLGSGGARGYAGAGVIEALKKNHIKINLIVGTSAGSIIGAIYADQGNIGQTKKILMSASFFDFADINNIPHLNGLISGYHLQKFLLRNMKHKEFSQLHIPLVVVTTNIQNGKRVLISSGPIAPAVNASSAIPGVLDPVKLYGKTLVDGGISDPIATDIAKYYKAQIIIAVDVDKQLSPKVPITGIGLAKRGVDIALNNLGNCGADEADVVIRPQLTQNTFDIADKKKIYKSGYTAGMNAIPQIKNLMRKKNISQ